jgi:hypothetical protein
MRTYNTQTLTSSIPTWSPDEAPPVTPGAVAPPLPGGEEPSVLGGASTEGGADSNSDSVSGNDSQDSVSGGEGNDSISGADGNDSVAASSVPDAYELTVKIDGKDVVMDAALVEQATPIFKELGFSNEQAQGVAQFYATQVLPEVSQVVQQQTLDLLGMSDMGQWAAQIKADKEIGGANYEQNLTLIAAGRDAYATPELVALFEKSRLGNHPEVARLFLKLGKSLSEGDVTRGDGRGAGEMSAAQILYGQEYQKKS